MNPVDARRCAGCWGELTPSGAGRSPTWRERRRSPAPYALLALIPVAIVVWAIAGALAPRYPLTVRAGLLEFTVTGREIRPNVPLARPSPDPDGTTYQTIVLAVRVRNHGDRLRTLDPPNQITILDRSGHLYRALPYGREADLPDAVPPGGEVDGHVAFRVPAGTSGLRLVIATDRTFGPREVPLD